MPQITAVRVLHILATRVGMRFQVVFWVDQSLSLIIVLEERVVRATELETVDAHFLTRSLLLAAFMHSKCFNKYTTGSVCRSTNAKSG